MITPIKNVSSNTFILKFKPSAKIVKTVIICIMRKLIIIIIVDIHTLYKCVNVIMASNFINTYAANIKKFLQIIFIFNHNEKN